MLLQNNTLNVSFFNVYNTGSIVVLIKLYQFFFQENMFIRRRSANVIDGGVCLHVCLVRRGTGSR